MKKINKFVEFFLIFALIVSGIGSKNFLGAIENDTIFFRGDGTAENPFEVSNAEQLNAIRNDLDAYYVQTKDIDLAQYANWVPIGDSEEPFIGSYNGNGYVIKNLSITEIEASEVGLFGECSSTGTIKNITLIDLKFQYETEDTFDTVYVGGVVGVSTSTIENCSVSGNITIGYTNQEYGYVGGVVGYGEVENCSNYLSLTAELAGTDSWLYCGGVCGWPGKVSGEVVECTNYGDIVGISAYSVFCGGIIGADGYVMESVNYGDVCAKVYKEKSSGYNYYEDVCAGGIVGSSHGEISQCINYGNIYCNLDESSSAISWTGCAGGIAGAIGFYADGIIKNCYSLGEVIELKKGDSFIDYNVGRIAGYIGGYNQIFYDNWAYAEMLVNENVVEESDCGAITQNGANYIDNIDRIILTPANGSNVYISGEGKITFRLETSGTIEMADNDEAYMNINGNGISYSIYGNGTAACGNREGTWSELGIEMNVGEHYLEVLLPDIPCGNTKINFGDDFIYIDGQAFNTYENDEEINPWAFYLYNTYNSFSFENYSVDNISKELIAKIFPWGQRTRIYNKNAGSGGLCYGMSTSYAGISYSDFLSLSDFNENIITAWELSMDSINSEEEISLDEFIQMCQLAQQLPTISKTLTSNASFGNEKSPENIERLVNSVKKFKDSDGSNPVIVSFSSDNYYEMVGESESKIYRHAVLVYIYVEDDTKTTLIIYDSNYKGVEKTIELYKENGEYTGEWYYTDIYQSSDLGETYITYSQPLATLKEVYYSDDKKNDSYILEIPKNVTVIETDLVYEFFDIASNDIELTETDAVETDFYWVEDEACIVLQDVVDEVSVSGDTTEILCGNFDAENVEIYMDDENYSVKVEKANDSDANITYEFYDDSTIEKLTIYLGETGSEIITYNDEKLVYVSGAEELRIVHEEGVENETGNYVEIDSEEKNIQI